MRVAAVTTKPVAVSTTAPADTTKAPDTTTTKAPPTTKAAPVTTTKAAPPMTSKGPMVHFELVGNNVACDWSLGLLKDFSAKEYLTCLEACKTDTRCTVL